MVDRILRVFWVFIQSVSLVFWVVGAVVALLAWFTVGRRLSK